MLFIWACLVVSPLGAQARFIRGDVEPDGTIKIADPVRALGFLFLGNPASLPCLDAADANDDGAVNLSDAVFTLGFLFLGTSAPAAPFPACGVDSTGDALSCGVHAACLGSTPPPAPPVLIPPPRSTRQAAVTVEGTTLAGGRVVVHGGERSAEVLANAQGAFSLEVALSPNQLNRLYAVAVAGDGRRSAPAALEVIQDSTPPELYIDEPLDGAQITEPEVTVAGRVADRLSGFQGLSVLVGGEPANVAIGIGTNGTFERGRIPLAPGPNTIVVAAADALGNTVDPPLSITVDRLLPPEGSNLLTKQSGDLQTAPIHALLPAAIVVKAATPNGEPLAGASVTFGVTRSDGLLAPTAALDAATHRSLTVQTGADGTALVYWRLGSDAGCGNNRVAVSSPGLFGALSFCASATPGPAAQINIGSGQNQRLEAGAPAPQPLRAWVSDSCNGIPGVPVTFSVTRGSGTVNGQTRVTVPTGPTGHAEVSFVLGPETGNHWVEAQFDANSTRPAVFTAYALARDETRPTTFAGIVLDNAHQALGGAVVILEVPGFEGLQTTTDIEGSFLLAAPEAGAASLRVEGYFATRVGGEFGRDIPQGSFPSLTYEVVLVPNAENTLPGPVLLPQLDPENGVDYDGTSDVTLRMKGIDGLELLVKAGTRVTLANGTEASPQTPVRLSLDQVHHDDVPMPMPDGAAPPFAWTLQPARARFDPPIQVTYPNMSGLPPGAIANFLAFDHDTQEFEIVSSGHVSEDGATIVSDRGSGLPVAGWQCNCPPYSVTGDCEKDPCKDSREFLCDKCDEERGSGAGALSCQLACLAKNGCEPNRPPWVRCTINDYADNRRRGNTGPAEDFCENIPAWVPVFRAGPLWFTAGDLCFAVDGTAHLFTELIPTWMRKCNELKDDEHNDFLDGILVPCLLDNPDLGRPFRRLGAATVPLFAGLTREIIQAVCASGGSGGGLSLPPRPPRSALFSGEIAAESQLVVSAPGDAFFLAVGGEYQLAVTRKSNGTDVTTAASGTMYLAVIAPLDGRARDLVTLSPDGRLRVLETPSAFSALPHPLLIAVRNGDDLAVGQFALTDADSDADGIVDSFERNWGFDPNAANDLASDDDADGLELAAEILLGTQPLNADTDGDGVPDGEETAIGADPRDPSSRLPSFSVPSLALFAGGGGGLAPPATPDSPPVVRVNGQPATANADGSFRISNISAADGFGPDGPGTRPDFLSDDYLRAAATFARNGKRYWAFSDPFQLAQGETFNLNRLTVTETPPPLSVSLRANIAKRVLRPAESTALIVTGILGNGSEIDLTSRSTWTVYRTSNPRVATVGREGEVKAVGPGGAFLTAVNEGATAVARVEVVEDRFEVIVEGAVQRANGAGAPGARITSSAGGETTSGPGGAFALGLQVGAGTRVTVVASLDDAGTPHTATFTSEPLTASGRVSAGVLVLQPYPAIEGFAFIGLNAQGYPEYRHIDTAEFIGTDMIFVLLRGEGGGEIRFSMGSPESECPGRANERPAHEVRLSPYLIGKYECTQGVWEKIMGPSPWGPTESPDWPVGVNSWLRIQDFEARTGLHLPSEAQWEYACRGGTTTPFAFGVTLDSVTQASFWGTEPGLCDYARGGQWLGPMPVGSYPPNDFGIHDAHGNYWEWCEDSYEDYFYEWEEASGLDPVASSASRLRVLRGGGADDVVDACRCAARGGAEPGHAFVPIHTGFRPAKSLR